jgi:hypothetical protein
MLAQAKAAALVTFFSSARARKPQSVMATDVVAIAPSVSLPAPPPALPIPPEPPPPSLTTSSQPSLAAAPAVTPLRWQAFQHFLRSHPDQSMVAELVHDLQHGVRVGYTGPRDKFRPAPNLPIAPEHCAFVDEEIAKEVELGRRIGPFDAPPFPNLMVSPIGVVTKKLSIKLRMIHHLSWPRGSFADSDSINEHISAEESETVLQSFDDAVRLLAALPPVSAASAAKPILLSKVDIKSAYRLVPVHPDDWPLLGMQWRGKYYYDNVLVFGLSSSCRHWERVATAAHWIAEHLFHLKLMVHYIDDYLLISVGQELASLQLAALLKLFRILGLPISVEKLEGPTPSLPFLGIQIDTSSMTIALEPARLSYVQSLLSEWMNMSSASIQQLQSLTGTLSFCCRVIRSGRIFLRRLINYTTHLSKRHKGRALTQARPLTDSVKKDIVWWMTYMKQFNGSMSIYPLEWCTDADMYIATDAGQQGYGAVFGKQWFYGTWSETEEKQSQRADRDSMPWKELHTLVRAAATWGHEWKERNILFRLDCQPMVYAVTRGGSRDPEIMSLLRTLSYLSALNNFHYQVQHIPGLTNVGPDHLSRGRVSVFQSLFPNSNPLPVTACPLPCHTW